MCRYSENIGATLGAIVDAMAEEAKVSAFCLATDAMGVAIQPSHIDDRKRHPCRKGHFCVVLADIDHVFIEYQPKHTSKAVSEMLRGFHGYIQAYANVVYAALFRGRPPVSLWEEEPYPPPKEVGCYSQVLGRSDLQSRRGTYRARLDRCSLCSGLAAVETSTGTASTARLQKVLPLVNTFFDWVREEVKKERSRGLVSKA